MALDELVNCEKLPVPDLIKCAIEDGEYDALSGASDNTYERGLEAPASTKNKIWHGFTRCYQLLIAVLNHPYDNHQCL